MQLLLGLLSALSATADHAADHAAVRDAIVAAMNDFPTAPAKFLGMLEADSVWCDPFPSCQHGTANISSFLHGMPPGTDTILIPENMVTVGSVGGMMTTLSFSWPGEGSSCLYTADQHVSWNLSSSSSSSSSSGKLNYVRWVYNASEFDAAIGSCLGGSSGGGGGAGRRAVAAREAAAATAAAAQRSQPPARDADLQAVHDYVVSLQYSRAKEALICDLLVPTARYCDPYPESCAFGRAGCRAMKGLPNDTSTLAPAAAQRGGGAQLVSQQCRPGSVRPLMATGPATGALYLAYSSASRNGSKLSHKMHHTYAIWDLAPASTLQQAPAPMLASFDWFMPNQNV